MAGASTWIDADPLRQNPPDIWALLMRTVWYSFRTEMVHRYFHLFPKHTTFNERHFAVGCWEYWVWGLDYWYEKCGISKNIWGMLIKRAQCCPRMEWVGSVVVHVVVVSRACSQRSPRPSPFFLCEPYQRQRLKTLLRNDRRLEMNPPI